MYSEEENFENWSKNFKEITALNVPIIHSFIPNRHTKSINYNELGTNIVPPVTQIDYARDKFHYGTITNAEIAKAITNLLAVG
jgi:hypothetical protein